MEMEKEEKPEEARDAVFPPDDGDAEPEVEGSSVEEAPETPDPEV